MSIFYNRPWKSRGKTTLQSFWTNSRILSNRKCFGFSQMKRISAKNKWGTYRTTVDSFYPPQNIPSYKWWKPSPQYISWCLEWSLAMMTLYHHSSSHMASHLIRSLTSSAWRRSCGPGSRGCLQDSASYHTSRSQCWLRIYVTSSPLKFLRLTSHIAILLVIMCENAIERETSQILCNTKDELKVKIMAAFINLKIWKDCWKSLQEIPKSSDFLNRFNLLYFKLFSYNFG